MQNQGVDAVENGHRAVLHDQVQHLQVRGPRHRLARRLRDAKVLQQQVRQFRDPLHVPPRLLVPAVDVVQTAAAVLDQVTGDGRVQRLDAQPRDHADGPVALVGQQVLPVGRTHALHVHVVVFRDHVGIPPVHEGVVGEGKGESVGGKHQMVDHRGRDQPGNLEQKRAVRRSADGTGNGFPVPPVQNRWLPHGPRSLLGRERQGFQGEVRKVLLVVNAVRVRHRDEHFARVLLATLARHVGTVPSLHFSICPLRVTGFSLHFPGDRSRVERCEHALEEVLVPLDQVLRFQLPGLPFPGLHGQHDNHVLASECIVRHVVDRLRKHLFLLVEVGQNHDVQHPLVAPGVSHQIFLP
mmetsp:Transcript_5047/g.12749  ORF Transcript_5047/g.12749 Transcript_5047/m.12749 type:complete len:353 (+) Transcript_5047:2346-3404(+)